MDMAGVQAAFKAAGLSRVLKDIDALARPSIRLYATPAASASALKLGASKLGGAPDLPTRLKWPEWNGLPQSFIAQIHLPELAAYDVNKVLPSQGMLWFFYDAQQQTYGDKPTDRGAWSVFFQDDEDLTLQRVPVPAALPAESKFQECALRFATEITLSQQPQLDIANFDWSDEEQEKYETLLSDLGTPDERKLRHRMLGNPDTIQDDMRLQCQLNSNGVSDANDPRAKALAQGANDWRLLLQVDTDERIGMRWASSGMLYYWIRQSDLQARRFDGTWFVLQSE